MLTSEEIDKVNQALFRVFYTYCRDNRIDVEMRPSTDSDFEMFAGPWSEVDEAVWPLPETETEALVEDFRAWLVAQGAKKFEVIGNSPYAALSTEGPYMVWIFRGKVVQ